MINTIGEVHHIGYLVKNMEKSIRSFKILGYEMEKEIVFDKSRRSNIAFLIKDGFFRVELVKPQKDSDVYPLLKKYTNSPYHICYRVDDINKSVSKIGGSTGFLQFKGKQQAPAISEEAEVVFLMHAGMGIIELVQE